MKQKQEYQIKKAKLQLYKNKRFIYVTSDHSIIKKYIKNNLNVLFVQTWKMMDKIFYEKWENLFIKKFKLL